LPLKEAFKAACERAGIEDFRFHDLRHTAASLLAGGGCDIITLQHILGHKSLSMTQRYAHLIPGRLDRTREIMQGFWDEEASNFGGTKRTQSGGEAEGKPSTH
jgi:integrase